jgi:hypothetical protein
MDARGRVVSSHEPMCRPSGLIQYLVSIPLADANGRDVLPAANSYSVVLLRIVQSQLAANNGAEAEKQCATAVQVLESAPEANRQDAVSQRRLVNALTMLGRAMLMNGNKLFRSASCCLEGVGSRNVGFRHCHSYRIGESFPKGPV